MSKFCGVSGAVPTMVTPFTASNEIDVKAVDELVDFFVSNGCGAIFTNCLSSEMFALSPEERKALTARVTQTTAKRVPVLSCATLGGIAGGVADDAKMGQLVHEIAEIGSVCDVVVLVVSELVGESESDELLKSRIQAIFDAVEPNIPLGLYECPQPYKRLLSPQMLQWLDASGRVFFVKDTCCDLDQLQSKVNALPPQPQRRLRLFNANIETLLPSLRLGVDGFCGICANFYPHLPAFLCAHNQDASLETICAQIQSFVGVGERVVCDGYPMSAKAFLKSAKLVDVVEASRVCGLLSAQQRIRLEQLRDLLGWFNAQHTSHFSSNQV